MRQDTVTTAERIQREAADPGVSVVLKAGAGTGKTKVLVDRYIRLCLGGSAPRSILAVTFTRKAAVEIKERLLSRAASFATAKPRQLVRLLTDLLDRDPTADERDRAPTLFARLLEDLAALPVGTIHSFCQTLLSRFACETGLDPGFGVIEKTDELWEEALDRLEVEAAAGDLMAPMTMLSGTPADTRRVLGRLFASRSELDRWIARVAGSGDGASKVRDGAGLPAREVLALPAMLAELRALLFNGTPLASSESPAAAALLEPLAEALRELAGPGLDAVAATQQDAATPGFTGRIAELRHRAGELAVKMDAQAAAANEADRGSELFAQACELLLTNAGSLRKLPGKKEVDLATARATAFECAAAPVLSLIALTHRIAVYDTNRALLTVGLRALAIYRELKQRDRVLDFHDLEERAWRLMTDPEEALHVQYRLDDAFEHLLLDEFQDTNDNQWELLQPFVVEFLSGPSSQGRSRTVLLVGDVKQSIYRFRGARPEIFGRVALELCDRKDVLITALPTNFRSLPAVVDGVGSLFTASPLRDLLPADEVDAVVQQAARDEDSGALTLVAPVVADAENDVAAAEATAALVEQIVPHQVVWHSNSPTSCNEARPARYDDVLILSRSRTRLGYYERALRERGIPIVPSGRGTLATSREVQDVLALMRWLVFPQDDPSLAATLRSPLFRLSEERLQELLARRRPGRRDAAGRSIRPDTLWAVMRRVDRAVADSTRDEGGDDGSAHLARVVDRLRDWQGRVDRESCHALLRRIYRETDALVAFAAALGQQARFNLLRVLDLALGPEIGPHPTMRRLTRVVERAARTAGEEEAVSPGLAGRGRVRLMTIHAAKGLEAPVVLLVDADRRLQRRIDRLRLRPDTTHGPVLFGLTAKLADSLASCEGPDGAVARGLVAAENAESAENANLLYVALTRARDRCWVLGGADTRHAGRSSYLRQLEDAAARAEEAAGRAPVERAEAADLVTPLADATRVDGWGPSEADRDEAAPPASIRTWQPPSLTPRIVVASPSDLVKRESTATGSPGAADRRQAIAHGNRVHAFLQAAADAGRMPPGSGTAWEEANAVYNNPEFAWIFHPAAGRHGASEVPVIHGKGAGEDGRGEARLLGSMDRIVVGPQGVDIIDYKSNLVTRAAEVENLCQRYRPQLEAYGEAMAALGPPREIRLWLLLTHPQGSRGRGLLRMLD